MYRGIRASSENRNYSTYFFALLIFMAAYVFSEWILKLYTEGDQKFYIALYNALSSAPFGQISDTQVRYTGSTEPLYGFLMWTTSPLLDKNIVISISNSILMTSIFLLLRKYKAGFIFTALIFTNYYVLVLLTSAERLKYGYMFAILAALSPALLRAAGGIAALLSHYSILIVFVSILLPPRYRGLVKYFQGKEGGSWKSFVLFIATFFAFILFCIIYSDQIIDKVSQYQSYDITDMARSLALLLVAILVTSDRLNMAITLSFPLVATFILGGDRVNMLAISIFIYLVLREGKTNHPAVIVIMAYLSYKSLDFIQNVLAYGTGYLI
ncbi:hypothetical protein [Sphingopyxis sp. Root214]|uniref:hypothetical protein n=2 Tax=unclassified Sphingopyxis TaxID=2614943 RepID=UPI000A3FA1A8|nr:hypothetical protein [Sphingopyxis sp. Root214]